MKVGDLKKMLDEHDDDRIVSIMYLGDDAGVVDAEDTFTVHSVEDDVTFDDNPRNHEDVPGVTITLTRREG